MSKGGKKKRSTAGLILDVILTLCTGGLWLSTCKPLPEAEKTSLIPRIFCSQEIFPSPRTIFNIKK